MHTKHFKVWCGTHKKNKENDFQREKNIKIITLMRCEWLTSELKYISQECNRY